MLSWARTGALAVAALITVAASGTAFAESYRGLMLWAAGHGVPGVWGDIWPLMVDAITVIGEIALFVGLVDGAKGLHRVWPWCVVAGGLTVSVAGNIGHEHTTLLADRATAAVPPLAAYILLTIAFGVLKRLVAGRAAAVTAVIAEADARTVIAALHENGVTDTNQLAQIAGVAPRTARRYKQEARHPASGAAAEEPPAVTVATTAKHQRGEPRLRRLTTVPAEGQP